MVTLTLNEITLNATIAALDERVKRLEAETLRLAEDPKSEDRDRAIVWGIAALHETKTAREVFGDTTFSDHPVDAAWTTA